MKMTYIIGEAGVNHNGDIEMAKKLIDVAAEADIDAVKFQTFRAEDLVTKDAELAEYQKNTSGEELKQFDMLSKLELDQDAHLDLQKYCLDKEIDFLSTPFDLGSLNFLTKKMHLKTLKIPSGELTNGPLLIEFAKTGCNIIISTGMSSLEEIELAIGSLIYGFLSNEKKMPDPSIDIFKECFEESLNYKSLLEKITLMHCMTEYPAPIEEANLSAIKTLRDSLNIKVGYSDHTDGILAPLVAVAFGATIIEKHFTLDKELEGPDHKASLEPIELKQMVQNIRLTEQMLGDGIKRLMPSEKKNLIIARKSITAFQSIKKGEEFTTNNITIKRPGTGISPMEYWKILGKRAPKDFAKDETIKL